MGYQNAPATQTVTRDGQPVALTPDYTTKTVSVSIGGEYVGTYHCHTAAKEALGLIEVPAQRHERKQAGRI